MQPAWPASEPRSGVDVAIHVVPAIALAHESALLVHALWCLAAAVAQARDKLDHRAIAIGSLMRHLQPQPGGWGLLRVLVCQLASRSASSRRTQAL